MIWVMLKKHLTTEGTEKGKDVFKEINTNIKGYKREDERTLNLARSTEN